jgi:hypothetical protein
MATGGLFEDLFGRESKDEERQREDLLCREPVFLWRRVWVVQTKRGKSPESVRA